jgi:hypothetical protein
MVNMQRPLNTTVRARENAERVEREAIRHRESRAKVISDTQDQYGGSGAPGPASRGPLSEPHLTKKPKSVATDDDNSRA